MDVCFKPTRFEAEGFFSKYGPTNYPPAKVQMEAENDDGFGKGNS